MPSKGVHTVRRLLLITTADFHCRFPLLISTAEIVPPRKFHLSESSNRAIPTVIFVQSPTLASAMSVFQDKALAMFFDEQFSPTDYVDALMENLADPAEKYLPQSLARMATRVLDLLSHLDYTTGEISKELADNMQRLEKLAQPIGAADDTLRIDYYLDSLRNSVETLESEVQSVKQELRTQTAKDTLPAGEEAAKGPVQTLITLKEVRANILQVLQVLQGVRALFPDVDAQAITVESFLAALTALQETLKTQAREGVLDELRKTVEELKTWSQLFVPFVQFGPVYAKFVGKLAEIPLE